MHWIDDILNMYSFTKNLKLYVMKANILGFLRISVIREFKKIQAKYFNEILSVVVPEALTIHEHNLEYQAILIVNLIPSDEFRIMTNYYELLRCILNTITLKKRGLK